MEAPRGSSRRRAHALSGERRRRRGRHALLLEARVAARASATRSTRLLANAADFAWDNDMATLLTMLRADDAAWTRAGLGNKSAFLRDAQAREAAAVATNHARSWGEANTLGIHHPFGYGGGLLAWLFNPPSHPQSGGPSTVHASSPTSVRACAWWSTGRPPSSRRS